MTGDDRESSGKRDRLARFYLVLSVLRSHGERGVHIDEIARRVGVSRRTAYRDLRALEGEIGIAVWNDNGRWGVAGETFLPPLNLTLGEAMAVVLSARLMARYADKYDPELAAAFTKLEEVLPPPLREHVERTLAVLAHRRTDPRFNRHVHDLVRAWAERRIVHFRYVPARFEGTEREPREARVRPYLLEPSLQTHALYLIGYGTQLRKDGNHFIVAPRDGEPTRIRPIDISHVAAFGTVTISTSALHALLAQETPIAWLTRGGRFLGLTSGLMGKNIQLRRRQFTLTEPEALELARAFVIAKIRNQRTLLRRNSRFEIGRTLELLADAVARARLAPDSDTLRGIEGYAARLYFNAFPAMLRRDLPFTPGDIFRGRNRRPPRDPVNALLSFAYTLLTKDLAVQAQLIGFDPYWGFYHRPKFGRPALALDLAEEFRPLIADSVVITALNNSEITSAHVRRLGAGYALTDDGRRTFLRIYERRLEQEITHPRFRYRLSYRRLLDLQPRFLAAVLLGELPAYQGFETR
ncbi:MAG: CRISPR-associated endonuclease Cas1 [Dehalococcoidia bacterium]|nr:CRISPR-associated endonuclease Cas1 [Dehalococcoidia bacterium]